MAGVANLFIRVRGAENRIESRQQQQPQPLTKPGQIIITSGEPKTHPSVERVVAADQPGLPVEFAESYVCAGGVNVVPLLVATRCALQERVEALGADTLTNEQCVSLFSHIPSRILISSDGNALSSDLSLSLTEFTKFMYVTLCLHLTLL